MNVHMVTPTQARLAQERREREARALMAAAQKREAEAAALAKLAEDEQARAERRFRASEASRRATKRHRNLVDSWRFMVSLAEQNQRLIDVSRVARQEARRFLAAQVTRRSIANDRAQMVQTICEEVAAKYGFSIEEMKSENRGPLLLLQARYEFWWRAWRETGLSMRVIADVAHKDRTTVIHGVGRYRAMQAEVKGGAPAFAIWRGRLKRPDMIITEAVEL